MDISPVLGGADSDTSAGQVAVSTVADSLKVDANFDTFLSLLTAQLRNQDPLEPLDSTDFVAQLAQFSAVEQQVQTNNALGDILVVLGGSDIASLATWLDASVQAVGPVYFDGAPVTLTTTPTPEATQSTLIVRNSTGDIISRQPVNSADEIIAWNGQADAGGDAREGLYSFTVESTNKEGVLPVQQAVGFSKVEEVRIDGDAPVLILRGGDVVALDDVMAVR